MRPRSDPPNFGSIERGEKQTNNIDYEEINEANGLDKIVAKKKKKISAEKKIGKKKKTVAGKK